MIGTLTMNHMTITKILTLENDEILDVEKSVETISAMGNDTAVKRLLRIGSTQQRGLSDFRKFV